MVESQAIQLSVESNRDIKITARRFRIYWMYLSGELTQQQIADAEGIDRSTVDADLTAIREHLAKFPVKDMEQIRQETYARMVMLRNEVMGEAREAKTATGKAKLYEVASKTDLKIIERYTQMGKGSQIHIKDDMGRAVVDYIKEKFGPEQLTDFISWYERRQEQEKRLSVASPN